MTDVFSNGMWAMQWAAVIRAIVTILIGIGLVWGSSIAQGARFVYLRAFPSRPTEDDSTE